MNKSTRYLGLDVHAETISAAIAEGRGRHPISHSNPGYRPVVDRHGHLRALTAIDVSVSIARKIKLHPLCPFRTADDRKEHPNCCWWLGGTDAGA
jgi:hypothetical protein